MLVDPGWRRFGDDSARGLDERGHENGRKLRPIRSGSGRSSCSILAHGPRPRRTTRRATRRKWRRSWPLPSARRGEPRTRSRAVSPLVLALPAGGELAGRDGREHVALDAHGRSPRAPGDPVPHAGTIPPPQGRFMAAHIPNGTYLEVPGADAPIYTQETSSRRSTQPAVPSTAPVPSATACAPSVSTCGSASTRVPSSCDMTATSVDWPSTPRRGSCRRPAQANCGRRAASRAWSRIPT